ncbi:MAG: DUF2330 domain-containing protein, partial [Deltaproteobacteria bacterium]|nr:DUF2330 domain-containing protein [Deltaproteobacteria bacterium]
VHVREEVGPFDVAVVESEDPAALVSWLRDNGFRVTTPMEPYIRVYTSEGKKFLALRLQPGEDVSDIQPFRFTLPGEAASIPIRMTALAAEPEMGITVFLLGDMRYGGANWPDVTIDDDQIVWRPYTWPQETNWTALVARGVDEAGGRGWVTEMAGPTAPFAELARSTTPPDEESQAAQEALLPLLEGNPYITRLYTRLAPEEMSLDPVFRRTGGADVSNVRRLPRYVDGRDLCESPGGPGAGEDAVTPCDFATCGAGGLCRVVDGEAMGGAGTPDYAGCACVPGTTARTTFDPSGRPAVSCVDTRMSFLNPGDREVPGADPLPDACVGIDCGEGSECVAMNMTPTCICAIGMVAIGTVDSSGIRQTRCVAPREPVPVDFYTLRVPSLPIELPGGRPSMELPNAPPPRDTSSDGGSCSAAGDAGAGSFALVLFALVGLAFVSRRRR